MCLNDFRFSHRLTFFLKFYNLSLMFQARVNIRGCVKTFILLIRLLLAHKTGFFVHIVYFYVRLLIVFFKLFMNLEILYFNALLLLIFCARLALWPIFCVVYDSRHIWSGMNKYSDVLKLRGHWLILCLGWRARRRQKSAVYWRSVPIRPAQRGNLGG